MTEPKLWLPVGPEGRDQIDMFYKDAGWGRFVDYRAAPPKVVYHPLLSHPNIGVEYFPIPKDRLATAKKLAKPTLSGVVIRLHTPERVSGVKSQTMRGVPGHVLDPSELGELPDPDAVGPYRGINWGEAVLLDDPSHQVVVVSNHATRPSALTSRAGGNQVA